MDAESSESLVEKFDPVRDATKPLAPIAEAQASLSKRLDDIVKSMQIINQRLMDLSIERRGQISQTQWATIEEFKSSTKANVKQNRFWQKSLFARTYFVTKDLDDLYKQVIKYSSVLFTYLKNLNGKLQCKSDSELDTVSTPRLTKPERIPPESSQDTSAATAMIVDLPQKTVNTTETASGNDEELDNPIDLRNIQQFFAELIRAKVEFDTQFLKFNAALSKTSYSEDFQCLYKICAKSNTILEQTSLSIDKCESLASGNGRLRRKRRQLINDEENGESHLEIRPRRSKRLAEIANEVQIIRSLKHVK